MAPIKGNIAPLTSFDCAVVRVAYHAGLVGRVAAIVLHCTVGGCALREHLTQLVGGERVRLVHLCENQSQEGRQYVPS
eukprot:879526-Pyramimonas_sp.AAC.1